MDVVCAIVGVIQDEVILGILEAIRSRDLVISRAWVWPAKSLDKSAGRDLQKASQGEVRRGVWYGAESSFINISGEPK